jgi:hypothetical protein
MTLPAETIRLHMASAAYTQWRKETGQLPLWEQLSNAERAMWRRITRAADDARIAAEDEDEDEDEPPF